MSMNLGRSAAQRLSRVSLYLDKRMHAIARELRPYDVGLAKSRFGRDFDGGYVIAPEALTNAEVLISYGLADDVSFETDVLEKHPHLQAHGFDGSSDIESLPKLPRLHYHREFIGTDRFSYTPNDGGTRSDSYANHLKRIGALEKRIFLKVDIEGAEWSALSDIPDRLWNNVQGIAIEFHDLDNRKNHASILTLALKLNQHFTLYHVNGNNYQGTVRLFPGRRIPVVLEACYIRTGLAKRIVLSEQTPPSEHDRPNLRGSQPLTFRYW